MAAQTQFTPEQLALLMSSLPQGMTTPSTLGHGVMFQGMHNQMETTKLPPPPEKVSTKYVDYTKFIAEHVSRLKFVSKTIEVTKKGDDGQEKPVTITRYRIPYEYNYSPFGYAPIKGDFHLQGPVMRSETGIQCTVNNGRKRYSIMFKFDSQSQEQQAFIEVLTKVYNSSCKHMRDVMDNVGMNKFSASSPEGTFNFIIFYRTEKGERVAGTRPSWYVDLYNYNTRKTVFKLLSEEGSKSETVEWDDLTNATVDMKPCFHIAFDKCGDNKCRTVVFLDSAVIYDAVPCGLDAVNEDAAFTSDVEAVTKARESIQRIRALNSKTTKGGPIKDSDPVPVASGDAPSFSALLPPHQVDLEQVYRNFNPDVTGTSDVPPLASIIDRHE